MSFSLKNIRIVGFFLLFAFCTVVIAFFFAQPVPLEPPLLFSPPDGFSTSTAPTFMWSTVAGVTLYRIQITSSSDQAFDSPIIDTLINKTSFIPPVALTAGPYGWRVRGENSQGFGPHSNVFTFIIKPLDIRSPAAPKKTATRPPAVLKEPEARPSAVPKPDTQPPTAPTNLTAIASSSSQVNLSWTASIDDFAIAGYKVYRANTQIATVVSTAYSDTGLSAGTAYSYAVSAFDAAGNVSAQSTSASATTQPAEAPPAYGGAGNIGVQPTSPSTTTQPAETQAARCAHPAKMLDLMNWKVTLPTGSSGSPAEIKQPTLATYSNSTYFTVNAECNGVRFRAPVNGVTTSGSSYPRSELREMANNGTANASWATDSGTHTMFIDGAITAVPKTKQHVVFGQVHNSSDDVIVIRLEYPKLFIDINGTTGPTLDANYTLGERFTVKFAASNGQISIYYNGNASPAYTLKKSGKGNYFKAGAYTQSNCSKELSGDCTSTNYGEAIIYDLTVTHS